MKVSYSSQIDRNNHSQLIDQMKHTDADISIGNNPVLPYILQNTWGWPLVHIVFNHQGIIVGHFQALKIRGSWVSLPHLDHGGLWLNTTKLSDIISADTGNPVSEEYAHHRLIINIQKILSGSKVPTGKQIWVIADLETGDFAGLEEPKFAGKPTGLKCRSKFPLLPYYTENKVISALALQQSYERQMETFSGNVRRKIRKALKNGIAIKVGGFELINQFYDVYRKNIHQLGSFALPKRFFLNLLKSYEFGSSRIIIAEYQEKNIGAAIYLDFMGFAENAWFASLKEGNILYVTYALHNKLISLAIEGQCKVYSFGRSTMDSGVHQFKKQWGGYDQSLFFNSTISITDSGSLHKFASPIIKMLPQQLVSIFDRPVSEIVY